MHAKNAYSIEENTRLYKLCKGVTSAKKFCDELSQYLALLGLKLSKNTPTKTHYTPTHIAGLVHQYEHNVMNRPFHPTSSEIIGLIRTSLEVDISCMKLPRSNVFVLNVDEFDYHKPFIYYQYDNQAKTKPLLQVTVQLFKIA